MSTGSIVGTGTARLGQRPNLAYQQFLAATRLARRVRDVETEHSTKPFGNFWNEILGDSMACVFLSAAGVESFANELLVDADESCFSDPKSRQRLSRGSASTKLLTIAKGTSFDPAAVAEILKRLEPVKVLRNELTHYKPEWYGRSPGADKATAALAQYLTKSKWQVSVPLFPHAWASYPSVHYVVSTVLDVILGYLEATRIKCHLRESLPPLRLPPLDDEPTKKIDDAP